MLEVAPALVRPARPRRNGHQLGRADDIDPSVVAVVEAQDLLAGDEPVLDDSVEIAADELGRALGPHPRRYPHLARHGAARDPPLQRVEVAAGERDLGQVKIRHQFEMAI